MIGVQRSEAMAARVGPRGRAAAVGRPPATRLALAALAAVIAAAAALAGLGRATLPRGDAGVSIAIAARSGEVTVRNGDPTPFRGALVVGSGSSARSVGVDLAGGESADVPLPAGVPCQGGLDVRLEGAGSAAGTGASAVMLRLPCASAAP